MNKINFKILSIFCLAIGCGKSNQDESIVAEQITINGLTKELKELNEGNTEFDFIGITSNGIDCLYFTKDKDKFNIEFEAMAVDQLPFIDSLKAFSEASGYEFKMTTYNNKMSDSSGNLAPVIRIITNSALDKTALIGKTIQRDIFKNSSSTIYDVVP